MDEYITKLQIHQHSLLTRKVFSRHNFSALVFFYGSSHHLHLQVIFIFKSYSSSSHLRLQVIFVFKSSSSSDLDHLSIWIIFTGLDLDHHSIWIIFIGSASSLDLDHPWCYLMILLITGSSIESALFHAGCRPSLCVGLL